MTMSYHMLTSSFLNPTRVSSLCYIRWETTAEPHSFLMLTKPFPAYCYLKALLPMAVAVPSLCWKYLIWKDWHLTFSWLIHFHRETQEGWGWQGPLDHWAQPPLKQGHPEPCPGGLWRSPRRNLHSLWAACASAPSATQCRCASWCSLRTPPVWQFSPQPLVQALGTTEKSPAPTSWHLPFRFLYTLLRNQSLTFQPIRRTPRVSLFLIISKTPTLRL